MVLGSTQPLTEMSTRNLPRGESGRRVRLTIHRHLWADCLENVGASTSHNHMGFHSLLQRYLYLQSNPACFFWNRIESLHRFVRHTFVMTKFLLSLGWRYNSMWLQCNGFDERVARQQFCKHGPTRNSRRGSVLLVRGDVTQLWVVVTWRVTCDACPILGYISDRILSVQERVSSRQEVATGSSQFKKSTRSQPAKI
jgi:hypothetical protein